ncbi:MAG TPA: chemotaxis protein CheB, partial [Bacteroidetes bacterium]|nr:chemotaxis protein CheB [Bacteroidota bacterium]
LPALPATFPCPLLIVQHTSPHSDNYMVRMLNELSAITVKEADEKEPIVPGTAYVAPPDYHLLVEEDFTLSLSVEEKVNYSRPSIDVLFETAADAYGPQLLGIVLTGANADGARGLAYIKKKGGFALVQQPEDAESPAMPRAAIEKAAPDKVLTLQEIISFLSEGSFCKTKS